MKLDKDFLAIVKPAIEDTWNYIGSDAIEFCKSNEDMLEFCIDANRLEFCGNSKEADKLVHDAVMEHGYNEVLNFLDDNVALY